MNIQELTEHADAAYLNEDYTEAEALFKKALQQSPKDSYLWTQLGNTYLDSNQTKQALSAFQNAHKADPDDDISLRQIAALSGDSTLANKCGSGYIEALFDGYAETFEQCLVDDLKYQTPQALSAMLNTSYEKALDLGCGTGLMAEALKTKASIIDGIDLSDKMLDEAMAKNLYRDLYHGDIVDAMENILSHEQYDLIIAADVLLYLGDLSSVFRAAKNRLANAGTFAFTVECGTEGDYAIQANNRFTHSYSYLKSLAEDNAFVIKMHKKAPLREEEGLPVMGHYMLLEHA